ncbi:conserved hypothetical protein [Rhodococcus phage E3]|uniref:hypothetical protein n=1 Tax=Rhodococcus phage E3 TaxID=1007869 RepID=UPI0002C699B2|nr:hypothetical protein M176_gp109 [Rhodococcus phage E3]AEQ21018.1 conserved hypothetical protein [Rhodococcus phage E3]
MSKPAAKSRAATVVKPEKLTISQLRTTQDTLFAQNNGPTIITCTVGTLDFQLEPKGHPGSISVLPKEVATALGFQKVWLKGLVTVTTDPAMEDEITNLVLGQNEAEAKRTSEIIESTEENSASKDLIVKKCLESGEAVYQSIRDAKSGIPPLAERFQDRAHEWIATQVSSTEFTFTKINGG